MSHTLKTLRALRARPRRLSHQVLVMLAATIATVLALLWHVTERRISDVALASSREWSESMARAAAGASAEPMAQADMAALETVLRDLATLPGVLRIETLDGSGLPLLMLRSDGAGKVQSVWRLRESDPRQRGTLETESQGHAVLQSWAPVGPGGALGSVGVTFLLERDRVHFARLRYDTLIAIALTGLLTMAAAYALLWTALRPLDRLVRFAKAMALQPGDRLTQAGGSVEIDELTHALNETSAALQQQLAALRASEDRLAPIVQGAPDAIVGFDRHGTITIASPAAASIFGCEASDLPGQTVETLLPELAGCAAEQRTRDGMYMRSSGIHVARWETRGRRRDGTEFPAEISLARVEAASGVRYAAFVRDNTERHMAEEMLALYGRALECTSNGIVISDLSLPGEPVFYANAAFETITGYAPSEAIGRNCAFLQREDRAQPELKVLSRAVQQGQPAKVVLRNYRKDGTLFFNELSIAPVRSADGSPRHYVGVLNDVTERERSRLAIAERNARLNAVFDLSPDGFVVFDSEGQLVYTNPVFLAMTGWEPSVALQGMRLSEFDDRMARMRDPGHAYPPLSMQASEDGGFDTVDLLHMQVPRPRVLTRLVRHNAGGQGESILYFRDVTHETEVDRMKSEFLTTAAHELRTPMVSVFGFTELLLNRPVNEERRRDMLQTIHRQASLLINMVNELLDLARIEARQGKDLQFVECGSRALIDDAVRSMGTPAAHTFVVEPGLADVRISGDAEKLQRALANVLSNAVKYSPAGGPIVVGADCVTAGSQEMVGLWVRDRGIGMQPGQVARVFERFYRADPSGNIPGTGLGMSLVKEIIELHQGHVEVASEPGVGTQVTLWLPCSRTAQAQAVDA